MASPSTPAQPSVSSRLRALFWLKFWGIPLYTATFFAAYIHLLKHPRQAAYEMPLLTLDRWIGVQPWALLLYGSLWVYVSLPPAMMIHRRSLLGYGMRIGTLCLVGLTAFFIWPTAVPLAHVDWAQYPGMAFLKGVDAAGNACPSLHVASAVFSAYWLHRIATHHRLAWGWRLLNLLWCLGITYSTLATKQHVAWDAIAGAALGLGMAWLTWPRPRHGVPSSDSPLDA